MTEGLNGALFALIFPIVYSRPSHRHDDKKSIAVRMFDQISEIKHSYENVWQLIILSQ